MYKLTTEQKLANLREMKEILLLKRQRLDDNIDRVSKKIEKLKSNSNNSETQNQIKKNESIERMDLFPQQTSKS